MAQDESDDIPRAPSATGRYRLIAGVVGACVLGAGLGLWARPSDVERPGSPKPAPAPAVTPASADRRIAIVVDDSPAPIGKPLDVLSASPPRPAIAPPRQQPQPPAPELIAPTRPPTGLVRVVAPVPGPMAPTPPRALAPAPPPEPDPVAVEKPAPPQPTAQALKAKADAAKLAHARKATQVAAKAKTEKLAKAKARRDRAHAHEVELAKAAPPPKPRHGLMALAHAFAKLAPHHAKAEPAAPVEVAEAKPERHHRADVHETRVAKAAPKTHPVRADPTPLTARGAGPLRLASATRCASSDPGEALACGDPTLGAAERRLSRAYRDAEAAGVPSSTLKQQQQRWIAARAAAAREAPWAVREVYQARIAELQDLVRDAKGD